MPIILHAQSPLVVIDFYYIEEKLPSGVVQYNFIRDAADMEKWRKRGYLTEDEIKGLQAKEKLPPVTDAPKRTEQRMLNDQQSYDPNKVINILQTEWKRLNWREHNAIFSRAIKTINTEDGKSKTDLDWILFNDLKLKTCLKRWNITNDRKEVMPVTSETIDMLPPEVAQELLNGFQKITEPSSDELKN